MKYMLPFKNWRIIVITLAYALTLMNAMADSDSIIILFATKVLAVLLGYFTTKLAQAWDREGKLSELEVFNDNEEED